MRQEARALLGGAGLRPIRAEKGEQFLELIDDEEHAGSPARLGEVEVEAAGVAGQVVQQGGRRRCRFQRAGEGHGQGFDRPGGFQGCSSRRLLADGPGTAVST